MIPVQEVVIKTIEGKRFQVYIEKPNEGIFEWWVFLFDPRNIYNTGSYKSRKQFKKSEEAFEEMIQFVNNVLEKQGRDKIEYLDNPCNCELVSTTLQKQIIDKQSHVFAIKVNGK